MNKKYCPSCKSEETMLPIVDSNKVESYMRFSTVSKKSATAGDINIGGPGFAVQCKACINCKYIAFYYDEEVTHSKKK